MSDFPTSNTDNQSQIIDATDIIAQLRERQWLLKCLEMTIDHLYFESSPETRNALEKVSTVLSCYDHDAVTERLEIAIALLSNPVKQPDPCSNPLGVS